MTAAGRITANKLTEGTRIRVGIAEGDYTHLAHPTTKLTGTFNGTVQGVETVAVKTTGMRNRNGRRYVATILLDDGRTVTGSFAPAETNMLAREDKPTTGEAAPAKAAPAKKAPAKKAAPAAAEKPAAEKPAKKATTTKKAAPVKAVRADSMEHIRQAFEAVSTGTFLSVSEICAFTSTEYGDAHPSFNVIDNALHSTKEKPAGVVPMRSDERKKFGARKMTVKAGKASKAS
jgi:hypothetical protein